MFGRHAAERTQSSWPCRSASRCVASLAPPPRSRDGGFGGAARRMNANDAVASAAPAPFATSSRSFRDTRQIRAVLSCEALASSRPGERSLPSSFEPSTSAFASFASLASSVKARSRTQSECPSSVAACSASTQPCSVALTSQRCSRTLPSAHPTAATTRAGSAPGSHASAADVGVALRCVVVVHTHRKEAESASSDEAGSDADGVSADAVGGGAGWRGASAARSARHILTVQSCDAVARR